MRVRGAITSEMYEDLNSAWIEMRSYDYERIQANGVSDFLDWVKMRSHLFRGVTFGTMLRDEAYHFIRLGTHMERADNTARILDTKYHILLPSVDRRRRRGRLLPVGVALAVAVGIRVVPQDLQRRHHAAADCRAADPARRHAALAAQLHELHSRHARNPLRRPDARGRAQAGELHARLHYGRTDDIMEFGLHEYLMEFLEQISELGGEVSRAFLVPTNKASTDLASAAQRLRSMPVRATDSLR